MIRYVLAGTLEYRWPIRRLQRGGMPLVQDGYLLHMVKGMQFIIFSLVKLMMIQFLAVAKTQKKSHAIF